MNHIVMELNTIDGVTTTSLDYVTVGGDYSSNIYNNINVNRTWMMTGNESISTATTTFERVGVVLTATFLVTIIFLAATGNILVCLAIATERSLRRIGNLFLASLAIADLFMSILVMTFAGVNDILGYWIFGAEFCDTWIAFDVMCSTSSILNLCAISLDRYIHIKDPLRYTRWVTRRVAVATIAAIWLLAAFVSFVPISLGLHRPNEPLIIEVRDGHEYQMCALDLTPTYAVVSSCISFYLPCVVLVGIYCRLYCYAQKHVRSIRAVTRTAADDTLRIPTTTIPNRRLGIGDKKKFNKRSPHQLTAYHTSDRKAATTVGIIMGVFLICWMPFFCVNIIAAFCKTCIGDTTFKFLSWLGYSNSAFNPIIYSIFNKEFRNAFKRILLRRQWPRLLCCGNFQNDYYVNSSNDSKFITNYDARFLHSTTDVEQLSAI